MIPVSVDELGTNFSGFRGGLPEGYDCTLIRMGEQVKEGLYKSVPEDLTQAGFFLLNGGTDQERRVYKTEYQPSAGWMYGRAIVPGFNNYGDVAYPDDIGYIEGQTARYRKIEHLEHGVCWELIPESITK